MSYLARIYVTPKPGVNDPQGLAILGGLKSLGYNGVERVRAGKYLEVQLDAASSADEAAERVRDMCQKLLANPVIEDFRFEITET
jgi:phosphoribosylformylglycinamidine synthase PurS subunit